MRRVRGWRSRYDGAAVSVLFDQRRRGNGRCRLDPERAQAVGAISPVPVPIDLAVPQELRKRPIFPDDGRIRFGLGRRAGSCFSQHYLFRRFLDPTSGTPPRDGSVCPRTVRRGAAEDHRRSGGVSSPRFDDAVSVPPVQTDQISPESSGDDFLLRLGGFPKLWIRPGEEKRRGRAVNRLRPARPQRIEAIITGPRTSRGTLEAARSSLFAGAGHVDGLKKGNGSDGVEEWILFV